MVDSITEDDAYRIENEYVGLDALDTEAIKDELDGLDGFDRQAAQAFAEAAAKNRPDPYQKMGENGQDFADAGQLEVVGNPERGTDRDLAVRDADGRRVGTASNTVCWTDRWGNTMVKPEGADMTQARKGLDSEDRQ